MGEPTLRSMLRVLRAWMRIPRAASGWRSWLLIDISASTAVPGLVANSSSL